MPPRIARTAAEAQVFLALLPCERCTATETDWDHGALFFLDDGGRAENYVGRCDRCGNVREVAFALPDPADGAGGSRFGGPEPSRLLDPAEWMRLAGTVELAPGAARRSGEQATRDRLERLEYARDAYVEALKFVPAGADAVPESALFSDVGRDRLRTEPASLTRGFIEAQLRGVEEVIAQLRRDGSGAPAGTAGPPPPRFDLPEDVERARRWLRGDLLGVARAVYPDARVVVERDDGPVAVNPGPDDEPADYVCAVEVAVAGEGQPLAAEEAVTRLAQALAGGGWQLSGPQGGARGWTATAERDGFVARVRMSADQAVLRVVGETPPFFLPPVRPPAFLAGEPERGDDSGPDDEPWVPASEQEEILQLAHRRGDLPAFFGLLRRMPLYVPVSENPDDPSAPVAYGTLDVDGQVHLAVYTSLGSLAYGLGDGVAYQETTYQRLAGTWPDPDWRLAVNGGSPIELYVSVEQVAAPAADAPPAGAEPGEPEPGFRPANEVERELHDAVLRQDWNVLIAALTRAPVPAWTPGPAGSGEPATVGEPGFRWQPTDVNGKRSIAVYTSLDRAAEAGTAGAGLVASTLTEIARSWPDRSYQLVLNPGSPIAVVLPAEAIPLVADRDESNRDESNRDERDQEQA